MKTVLVVDDNRQSLYLLQVLLSGNAYEVVQASNGIEALEAARRALPDLVISDILMPGMDGFALCRAWKSDERLKKIPFVFCTATYTDAVDEEFALSLGADRFITKPIEPDGLLTLLRELLAQEGAGRPVAAGRPIEEADYYRKYNAALVRKLEDKTLQLEETNRRLELDIAGRKRTEEILRVSESKYRTLIENIPQRIFTKDRESVYISCNRNYADDLNLVPDQIAGMTDYDLFPRELADKYRADDRRVMLARLTEEIEEKYVRDGVECWIRTMKTPICDENNAVAGVLGIFWDITESRRAEEERRKLRDQVVQAQKMESVGRLAGGIAHDFNNTLGVIVGRAELALMQLDPTHPLHPCIKEIHAAALRSADLTRQLLAFARRQPVNPRILNLNETMTGMLKILQRLIGENIELVWRPGADPWFVKMDPSQVDQILANLCVNARDAISGTGRVYIATENAVVTVAAGDLPEGPPPGEYVKLTVKDNGSGMEEATLAHLFEPFFTTKPVGKGTGLGLATVYGVVKQNEGWIGVRSAPGQGTTFEIYFPRRTDRPAAEPSAGRVTSAIRGQETVLLVEDNPEVMNVIRMMLESLGYRVYGTIVPGEAIRLAEEHADEIDLLITDLVMPQMNGREMARQIQTAHPRIRTLFMSGYSTEVIGVRGVLEEGVQLLQKPCSIVDLAARAREVLDSTPTAGEPGGASSDASGRKE